MLDIDLFVADVECVEVKRLTVKSCLLSLQHCC